MSAENVQGTEQGWKLYIGAFAPGTRKEQNIRSQVKEEGEPTASRLASRPSN